MLKTKINGAYIAYERCGKGTPLVLLHGYPLDHSIWEPLVPILENDFDLILPDLRGFGESEITGSDINISDYAADIVGILDACGIQKAIIAGHSMGGYVALAFAYNHKERLLGLGLVSSQILADTPEKKTGRLQEAEHILTYGVREVAEGMSVKMTAKPDLQIWLKELILRQHEDGLAGGLRAMAGRPDLMPHLSGFDLLLVLVHGLADGLISVERAREVKRILPQAHLTEIPDAGHIPMVEAPETTAEALKMFVKV